MGRPFAHFLLDSFAHIRANRKEQELIHGRADDLRTFFDAFVSMVESSGSAADRVPAINLLLHKILSRLHAEECVIYLSQGAGGPLQRTHCAGNVRDLDLFDPQVNHRIVEGVLKSGEPFLDNGINFELRSPFSNESSYIRSLLCLPLLYRDQRIGVIEVLNKNGGGFTDEDRDLMQMLARPLAVSINTIQMLDEAERLTVTDDLTKLYNYRYLMQYLDVEVKRCLRYKKKVSLLFIDVDGFKRVNDTFGHLVGSLALSEMGQLLRKLLRETDVVGRYGGDEFVVVLPETPLNGALVIAERIRKRIEDYEFVAQDLSLHLTISLGIANCPKHTLTAEGLIKKADAAMYRAKELSKNSVKIAV
jgi:diguanylate cyclase (GGDEF)-like protein